MNGPGTFLLMFLLTVGAGSPLIVLAVMIVKPLRQRKLHPYVVADHYRPHMWEEKTTKLNLPGRHRPWAPFRRPVVGIAAVPKALEGESHG